MNPVITIQFFSYSQPLLHKVALWVPSFEYLPLHFLHLYPYGWHLQTNLATITASLQIQKRLLWCCMFLTVSLNWQNGMHKDYHFRRHVAGYVLKLFKKPPPIISLPSFFIHDTSTPGVAFCTALNPVLTKAVQLDHYSPDSWPSNYKSWNWWLTPK